MRMPKASRARLISEALRPQVTQAIQLEQSKFRKQSTGPSLSHALRVIRELHRVKGYRPDQNMTQRPTVGMDAEYDRYDSNPESRWDPEFRQQLEGSKAKKLLKKKGGTKVDPKTGKPIDPKTGEIIGNEQDEVPNAQGQEEEPAQDPNADPNQAQQDPAQAQQAGDPQAQQDLDPNAGQQQQAPPELDDLPTDQRKDPVWKGNQPAKKADGQEDNSERVVGRYDLDKDPMKKKAKATTAYHMRQNLRKPQSHSKTGRHGPTQKYWS
jgi:hypothetical protein